MLDEMIYVSTVVHPSMSLVALSKRSISNYVGLIHSSKRRLSQLIVKKLSFPASLSDMIQYFRLDRDKQKLFWSNGIRMLLVEIDINKTVGHIEDGVSEMDVSTESTLKQQIPSPRLARESKT